MKTYKIITSERVFYSPLIIQAKNEDEAKILCKNITLNKLKPEAGGDFRFESIEEIDKMCDCKGSDIPHYHCSNCLSLHTDEAGCPAC